MKPRSMARRPGGTAGFGQWPPANSSSEDENQDGEDFYESGTDSSGGALPPERGTDHTELVLEQPHGAAAAARQHGAGRSSSSGARPSLVAGAPPAGATGAPGVEAGRKRGGWESWPPSRASTSHQEPLLQPSLGGSDDILLQHGQQQEASGASAASHDGSEWEQQASATAASAALATPPSAAGTRSGGSAQQGVVQAAAAVQLALSRFSLAVQRFAEQPQRQAGDPANLAVLQVLEQANDATRNCASCVNNVVEAIARGPQAQSQQRPLQQLQRQRPRPPLSSMSVAMPRSEVEPWPTFEEQLQAERLATVKEIAAHLRFPPRGAAATTATSMPGRGRRRPLASAAPPPTVSASVTAAGSSSGSSSSLMTAVTAAGLPSGHVAPTLQEASLRPATSHLAPLGLAREATAAVGTTSPGELRQGIVGLPAGATAAAAAAGDMAEAEAEVEEEALADGDESLPLLLHQMHDRNPEHVLVVRKINRLGFDSPASLRAHFEQFGPVEAVQVASSHLKARSSRRRVSLRHRPSGLGFVVMQRREDVEAILRQGEEQFVADVPIHVHLFQRRVVAQPDVQAATSG